MLLLILEVLLGNFLQAFVFRKCNLNKILFNPWKGLENIGLSGTFGTYTFKADKRSPVPVEPSDDLKELSNGKIIEVTAGKISTLHINLSADSEAKAKSL